MYPGAGSLADVVQLLYRLGEIHGRAEPLYHVKYAESRTALPGEGRGSSASTTTRHAGHRPPLGGSAGDQYGMWFSYRGLVDYRTDPRTSYRIGMPSLTMA